MNAGGGWRAAALARLDARLDSRSPAPIAVGVSGGGDSMALLHLAHAWAARAGRPLQVLTVDHQLHLESAGWARMVVEAAAGLGHHCRILQWTGPKPASGLPAAARAARQALLAEGAREAGARVILLGHTADDVAEGEWMRADGSTLGRLRDWGPSPAWPEGRRLMLLRPLLSASRAGLRAWLVEQGLSWLDDPANVEPKYARARARAALADRTVEPPGLGEGMEVLVERAAVGELDGAPGVLELRPDAFRDAHQAHRLLSAALLSASGGSRPPGGAALAGLLTRLAEGASFTATLSGARVSAEPGRILIGRERGRAGLPRTPVAAGEAVVWDGRFEITVLGGGVLRPAAGAVSRLSRGDREALRAAPAWVRPTLPLLETPDGGVSLARGRGLASDRLQAALGLFADEASLPAG